MFNISYLSTALSLCSRSHTHSCEFCITVTDATSIAGILALSYAVLVSESVGVESCLDLTLAVSNTSSPFCLPGIPEILSLSVFMHAVYPTACLLLETRLLLKLWSHTLQLQ